MPKRNIKKYFLLFLLAELLLAYAPAYAQTTTPYDYSKAGVSTQIEKYLCSPNASGATGNGVLYQCINQLYKFAIVLASVIGVFFIVIAGYIYMSASGNTESVDKAKSIIESTIVSFVILLGGWILLNAINPDLIQFHNVQPPTADLTGVGVGSIPPGTPVSDNYTVPNDAVKQMEGSGCKFQTDKQKNEATQMVAPLVNIVSSICYNITVKNKSQYPQTAGQSPTISSIIGVGLHATTSYHYKGCAVDFAAGNPNFVNTPMGQAIIQEAKNNGISASRINPGSDAGLTNMVHIDLFTSCPNSVPVNAPAE